MSASHVPTTLTDWERNCTETHQIEELKDASDKEAGIDRKLTPPSESKEEHTCKVVKGKVSMENTVKHLNG